MQKASELRWIPGYHDPRIKGGQDIRIHEYQDKRISSNQDTRIKGGQDIRIQGYQDNGISSYQDTRAGWPFKSKADLIHPVNNALQSQLNVNGGGRRGGGGDKGG